MRRLVLGVLVPTVVWVAASQAGENRGPEVTIKPGEGERLEVWRNGQPSSVWQPSDGKVYRVLKTLLDDELKVETSGTIVVVSPDHPNRLDVKGWENVVRIVDLKTGANWGTAFFHKSGYFVTAAHVLHKMRTIGAVPGILDSSNRMFPVGYLKYDTETDAAIFESPIDGFAKERMDGLEFDHQPITGAMVMAFGYPDGYSGLFPLASAGHYVTGGFSTNGDSRLVFSLTVNKGNSGGPIINTENGKVIGVATAKMIAPDSEVEKHRLRLKIMSEMSDGTYYSFKYDDGSTETLREGQILFDMFEYLYNQMQLNVGLGVRPSSVESLFEAQDREKMIRQRK